MKYKDLNLPKKLNLDILREVIPAEELNFMIKERKGMPREDRRIIFPSEICIRKCLIYHLVEKFDQDFGKVMDVLRNEHRLSEKSLHLTNIKRLYFQRVKEIRKENGNE